MFTTVRQSLSVFLNLNAIFVDRLIKPSSSWCDYSRGLLIAKLTLALTSYAKTILESQLYRILISGYTQDFSFFRTCREYQQLTVLFISSNQKKSCVLGTEDDLEYYVRECGDILGVSSKLPSSVRDAKHILDYIFHQIVEFKKLNQVPASLTVHCCP